LVKLIESDIRTREVLAWRGVHVLHYPMSSCSQKLRIYLGVKGIEWTPHSVDLSANESYGAWFMGINPRGMVPVLVIDGAVHIESNDIMEVLERHASEPVLWPADRADEIRERLMFEDDLHHDLRVLSFRFVHGRTGTTKTPELLAAYRANGAATVGGKSDPAKDEELRFYEGLAADGLGDARCRQAAGRFRDAFDDFERILETSPFLTGETPGVLDIAWFVYVHRLDLAGYPFAALHPRLEAWYRRLAGNPLWAREVDPGPMLAQRIRETRDAQERDGTTLGAVAGF
jgi:glutathione S-transferase